MRYLPYLAADPDFYDEAFAGDTTCELAAGLDTSGAVVTTRGPWRLLRTPAPRPETGWKVHVSCRPERAEAVVTAAVRLCLDLGVSCKHLRTRRLVRDGQAKYADSSAAGKVVAAYPVDEAALVALLDRLVPLLAGEPGARILSDVPVDGAPVAVRFGAFLAGFLVDDAGVLRAGRRQDGTLVVDDRSARGTGLPTSAAPAVVADLARRSAERDAADRLDVTDVRVLHRSNAGGVYAARWPDGRAVVLKEARHHTGFDAAEADAVVRLRHEHRALVRLAGSGVTPEVVAYVSLSDSDFLVMDHVPGDALAALVGRRHPALDPSADGAGFLAWVDAVHAATATALTALHARGVVHLDVHGGNVLWDGTTVRFVDFESCVVDGDVVATGVAHPLSHSGEDRSPAADLAALERLRRALLNPLYELVVRRPDLADELVSAGLADVGAGPEVTGPDAAPDADRLAAGIRVSATPHRIDRLFPGDVAQFASPGAGLGLLHGAAGVLWGLTVAGRPVPEAWRQWLLERVGGLGWTPPGLGDGAEGLALGLARIGEDTAARGVLDRWGAEDLTCPWWAGGAAGQALARAELGLRWGDDELLARAASSAVSVVRSLDADGVAPGHRAGLTHGWAGAGLALLRVAEVLEESDATATDALRAAAGRAFVRELDAVRVVGDAWMTTDGGRLMPYLGTGSAALGLLAAALEAAGAGDDRTAAAVTGVRPALRMRGVACAGLLRGRAGLALVLDAVGGTGAVDALAQHARRLRWSTVPVTRTARADHPDAERADLVLGEQNLRASADLATGAAGVLVAVGPGGGDRLARLLALPRLRAGQAAPSAMTPVTASR